MLSDSNGTNAGLPELAVAVALPAVSVGPLGAPTEAAALKLL